MRFSLNLHETSDATFGVTTTERNLEIARILQDVARRLVNDQSMDLAFHQNMLSSDGSAVVGTFVLKRDTK